MKYKITYNYSYNLGETLRFVSKNFPTYAMGISTIDFKGKIINDTGLLQHFKLVPGLCGVKGSISFESIKYPGNFLRHQNYIVKLHNEDSSDLYKNDASFHPIMNKFFDVCYSNLVVFS